MTTPMPGTAGALERLERTTWDSRVLPLKEDIRAVLKSHAELLEGLERVFGGGGLTGENIRFCRTAITTATGGTNG